MYSDRQVTECYAWELPSVEPAYDWRALYADVPMNGPLERFGDIASRYPSAEEIAARHWFASRGVPAAVAITAAREVVDAVRGEVMIPRVELESRLAALATPRELVLVAAA